MSVLPKPKKAYSETLCTMSLEEVVTEPVDLPDRIGIHGMEGSGKTSLAAQFPSPIFLMTRGEDGLVTLMRSGRLGKTPHFPKPATGWVDVTLAVRELLVKDHPYKTLVIDTVNGAEGLLFDEVCEKKFERDRKKFDAFGAGVKASIPEWQSFLNLLQDLRTTKLMQTILLCHTKVKSFKNPEGDDFDRYTVDMSEALYGLTLKWLDALLFLQFDSFTKKDDRGRVRGVGGQGRVLRTERTAAADAKNRLGLPSEIDCGSNSEESYRALAKHLGPGRPRAKTFGPVEES